MNRYVKRIKRAMDLLGSAMGLAATSPVLAATAIAIKLDDGGPIFYFQKRAGAQMDAEGDATDVYTFEIGRAHV